MSNIVCKLLLTYFKHHKYQISMVKITTYSYISFRILRILTFTIISKTVTIKSFNLFLYTQRSTTYIFFSTYRGFYLQSLHGTNLLFYVKSAKIKINRLEAIFNKYQSFKCLLINNFHFVCLND